MYNHKNAIICQRTQCKRAEKKQHKYNKSHHSKIMRKNCGKTARLTASHDIQVHTDINQY